MSILPKFDAHHQRAYFLSKI